VLDKDCRNLREAWDSRSLPLAGTSRKKLQRGGSKPPEPYVILYAQRPRFDA
jgi:hypothetical protein